MKHVIVVGGGPAGMLAAIAAARCSVAVTLLEKNEKLGKKLFITGKGRCNVTNASDMEVLFENICTNRRFLYSAFYTFDNQAVMDFFESLGLRLKTERGNRVFPQSDHSSDVINALQKELKRLGVRVRLHTEVKRVLAKTPGDVSGESGADVIDSAETIYETGKQGKKKSMKKKGPVCIVEGVELADGERCMGSVIIACGGISYPSTGSTGDGYVFAEKTGHKIVSCVPALVPLELLEEDAARLQGLSLKNVSAEIYAGKKRLFQAFGEMLFTHFGVSGPLMLSASSYIARRILDEQLKLVIDLKPAISEEQLDKRILREFLEGQNKQFKNVIPSLLPSKLVPVIMERSGIAADKPVHEITKEERAALIAAMKQFTFTITGTRGYNEAIITQGGVSVKDVDPSTMESKRAKRLYFAGEVLDLDALTGGYNLQIAWSTGYAAGCAAAQAVEE